MPSAHTATGAKYLTLRCQFCDTWNRIDAARASDRPKCGKCAKPMLLDRPVALTAETFSRTIHETSVPILVDFYADWCGPCKVMAPAVDQVASDFQGRALVAKVNTERAGQTSEEFDIRGIPTVIVFVAGHEVARQTGAAPKPALAAMLEGALRTAPPS